MSARQDLFNKCIDCFDICIKTSEDCDKYSKSVSYENLVETLLQTSPVIKLVKVLTLAAVLSIGILSESWAECIASRSNYWSNGCYDTWNPGVTNNCGDGCTYDYNNGKLTVTATKVGAVIPEGKFSPIYYESGKFPTVSNIEISGEFQNIGTHAFLGNNATITGKNGVLYVNDTSKPFMGSTLTGTIIVNDNQQNLILSSWYGATLNGKVILPPTINSINGMALYGLNLGENAEIYCGRENCEELFREEICNIDERYKNTCQNNLNTLLSSGKLHSYPDGCSAMNASGCSKCKNENFRLNDGECDRIRYTPAEAAQYLKDTDNEIIMTFKVNR